MSAPRVLWTDAEMLRALRLRDLGWTCKQIGERIGKSRGAVIGALNRIDAELARSEGC